MSSDLNRPQSRARALPARVQVLVVAVLVFAAGAGVWVAKSRTNSDVRDPDRAALSPSKKGAGVFYPTAAQWAKLSLVAHDSESRRRKIGVRSTGGLMVRMADDSVRFVQQDGEENTWSALMTRSRGEVLVPDW